MESEMRSAKLKNILAGAAGFVALAVASTPAAQAQEDYIAKWKEFAAETGLPEHQAWADMLDNDETRALEKAWSDYRGYTATSLIEAADLPDDLKPGLIITKDNLASMPWLADYLPQFWMDRLSSEWMGIEGIRIVPTTHYYMQKPLLDATKNLGPDPFSINEKGELIDKNGQNGLLTKAGLPFLNPKNGDELNWLFNSHGVGTEDLWFNPVVMTGCSAKNKVERTYTANMWWRKMAGRVGKAPLGNVPGFEGVAEAGALLLTSPRDVRGLAGVRVRFADADKDDNFKLFIPTLRRTRTLTGTNGQDPIAPSLELTWDEWRSQWAKTDKRKFKYTMVKEGFVLAAPEVGAAYDPYRSDDARCGLTGIVDMELRPVWVYDIDDLTNSYQYSKKRVWVDKELYYTQWMEMFDRRGNLWRAWGDSRWWQPTTGKAMWRTVIIPNVISKRHTIMSVTSDWEGVDEMDNALFDVDKLRDKR
tara:strand:+ start:161 stop:1588 length:1428 start_codon:yes stop_codon:yes gene_type:complete